MFSAIGRSITSGESVFVATATGTVYLQTRNIRSLAQAIQPYLPTASN